MGGVDLCDMLMSLYRIELGSKKWYTHIVYYCMELQSRILGSYIRNIAVKMALHSIQTCWHCLTSRQELQILCCIKKKTVIRGRPRTDSPVMMKHKQSANDAGAATEIPLDNVGHLPV